MAALDPQARIAMLERELEWANLTIEKRDAQIRLLEERLRQQRIQVLGPHSETLSESTQLELLAEDENPAPRAMKSKRNPAVSHCRRKPAAARENKRASGPREAAAGDSAAHRNEVEIACTEPNCKTCGAETSVIGYDESEVLDHEPARWFVRVTKREKRVCGKCSSIAMPELAPRIVEKGLAKVTRWSSTRWWRSIAIYLPVVSSASHPGDAKQAWRSASATLDRVG